MQAFAQIGPHAKSPCPTRAQDPVRRGRCGIGGSARTSPAEATSESPYRGLPRKVRGAVQATRTTVWWVESTLAIGTGDFSFSCWYKSDGALDGRVLASSVATTSATQLYWNVSVRSDGAVWLQTRSTANSGLQKWGKSATGLVTANTWHRFLLISPRLLVPVRS